jgi:serine/threonine protein kinase
MSYKIGPYLYYKPAIGKGSFSRVYQGYHVTTKQSVAIKKISKDSLKKISTMRLNKEIELIKKLDHPNIVKFFDVLHYNNDIYIISEYCDGGDFSNLLTKPLDEKTTKFYFKQLVQGLQYLQFNSIVHRDLKPKNILLKIVDDGHLLKIADFGFACEFEKSEMLETLCGTPLYMAPEIVKRNKYTPQTDLWSLGVILFEMLFHAHPYGKPYNLLDLIKKVEKNQMIIPDIKITDECQSLLMGLLQVDPIKRLSWEDLFKHIWLGLDEMKVKEEPLPETEMGKSKILESTYNPHDFHEKYVAPTDTPEFRPQSYEGDDRIFDLELDADKEKESEKPDAVEPPIPLRMKARDFVEDYYGQDNIQTDYIHVKKPKFSNTMPTESAPIPIPRARQQKTLSSTVYDYVTGSIDFLRNSLSNLHSY